MFLSRCVLSMASNSVRLANPADSMFVEKAVIGSSKVAVSAAASAVIKI
jgi:hypothetical protein